MLHFVDSYFNQIQGFVALRDSCYLDFDEKKSFQQAEEACRSHGDSVHLLSVMDIVEEDFAIAFANTDWDDVTWLGLQRAEGAWSWSDGWPVVFTNWDNVDANNESCAELWHSKNILIKTLKCFNYTLLQCTVKHHTDIINFACMT